MLPSVSEFFSLKFRIVAVLSVSYFHNWWKIKSLNLNSSIRLCIYFVHGYALILLFEESTSVSAVFGTSSQSVMVASIVLSSFGSIQLLVLEETNFDSIICWQQRNNTRRCGPNVQDKIPSSLFLKYGLINLLSDEGTLIT